MSSEKRCLITNSVIPNSAWYWYSWEMDAAVSEKGMVEIEIRRHDPDDEFAKLLWEEWRWSSQIGHIDL